MSITLRKSTERGHADYGWLQSRHSFSFGDYHDPAHMGFRSLRVINDDIVAPGRGFGSHPHRDMEIFSYVLEGALEHRDSMGNGRVLRPGQIQLMGAGSGVTHSEFNPSPTEPVRFLQIWIQPHTRGLPPSYTEWQARPSDAQETKLLVISPTGRDGSALIRQNVDVHRIRLQAGRQVTHALAPGRAAWLQVAAGALLLNDMPLAEGDGAGTEDSGTLHITADGTCEALLFDFA